jgi:hypothetical protein
MSVAYKCFLNSRTRDEAYSVALFMQDVRDTLRSLIGIGCIATSVTMMVSSVAAQALDMGIGGNSALSTFRFTAMTSVGLGALTVINAVGFLALSGLRNRFSRSS